MDRRDLKKYLAALGLSGLIATVGVTGLPGAHAASG